MTFLETLFLIVSTPILFFTGTTNNFESKEPFSSPMVQTEVLSVADGDTITVSINGIKERVRYIGIDTPERARGKKESECYAKEAWEKNINLVSGKEVRLVAGTEDKDMYGRLLRYVYIDDVFINQVLIEDGYARVLSARK